MKIPESIHQLFWEYDTETIDTVKHADVILYRIMERGGWAEMVWLLNTYTKQDIADFLERKGKRLLTPRELNYWALICDVPVEKRYQWVKEVRESQSEWAKRYTH